MNTKPKPRPIHYVYGMSADQYESLMREAKEKRVWDGMREDTRTISAILTFRECYGKMRRLMHFLSVHMDRDHPIPGMGFGVQNFHFKSVNVLARRMRVSEKPSNKATMLKMVDDFVTECAMALYPNDRFVLTAIARNAKRWASKRMPSSAKFKRGRKTGTKMKTA